MSFTPQRPLIDRTGPHWSESETHARLIGLTQGRAQLLRDSRRVLLIGPAGARITFPLLVAFRLSGSDWLTRSGAQLWAPSRGHFVDSPAHVFEPGQATVEPAAHNAVQIVASVHHRAAMETRLGRTVEEFATLVSSHPTSWGTQEPATLAWDRDAVTSFARSLAPRTVRLVVAGLGFSAIIRVFRTATGVTEETRFLAQLEDLPRVADCFERLAAVQRVLFASAFETHCAPDASIPPVFVGAPFPVAIAIGPQVARTLDVDALAAAVRLTVARRSTLVATFDGRGASAWQSLARAGPALGGPTHAS